jgi:hypothetical protein
MTAPGGACVRDGCSGGPGKTICQTGLCVGLCREGCHDEGVEISKRDEIRLKKSESPRPVYDGRGGWHSFRRFTSGFSRSCGWKAVFTYPSFSLFFGTGYGPNPATAGAPDLFYSRCDQLHLSRQRLLSEDESPVLTFIIRQSHFIELVSLFLISGYACPSSHNITSFERRVGAL